MTARARLVPPVGSARCVESGGRDYGFDHPLTGPIIGPSPMRSSRRYPRLWFPREVATKLRGLIPPVETLVASLPWLSYELVVVAADVRFAQGLGPLSVATQTAAARWGFARRSVHRAGALAVKIAQRPE